MRTPHNRKRRNSQQSKPQSHYNTFFDPMVFALDRIKAHFDEKAHFSHSKSNGQRVIKYALEDGKHIVLGSVRNSRMVLNRQILEFTEAQAEALARDLGML